MAQLYLKGSLQFQYCTSGTAKLIFIIRKDAIWNVFKKIKNLPESLIGLGPIKFVQLSKKKGPKPTLFL